jgi:hypothetical protein
MRALMLHREQLWRASRRCMLLCVTASVTTVAAQRADSGSNADTLSRRRIQPLPALASAPETGLQYGATVLAVWEPAAVLRTRPSSLTASALRTAKSQTRIRIDAERWSRGNAQRIAGSLQWQEFPLSYFGVGENAPASPRCLLV